ncbi:MAG TPA: hypothetical protein VGK83_07265, partial [Acidimicrobiia bacterium]
MERRHLPSVDQLVNDLGEWPLPRAAVVDVVRTVLDRARQGGESDFAAAARIRLEAMVLDRLGPVI